MADKVPNKLVVVDKATIARLVRAARTNWDDELADWIIETTGYRPERDNGPAIRYA